MLRKYIDSIIVVRYMAMVFTMAAVTLAVALTYNLTKIGVLYYLTIVAAIVEFVMIMLFAIERARSARQLMPVKHKEEFNHAVLLGNCMLIDKRMLAYKNGRVIESDYSNVREAALVGSPDRYKVRLTIGPDTFDAVVGSQHNAEILAGFLKTKNPDIVFHDLVPKGKGIFKTIQPLSHERPSV